MAERDLKRRKLSKHAIGDLRDRIKFERRSTIAPDYDSAELSIEFTEIATVWAKVETPGLGQTTGSGDRLYNGVNVDPGNNYKFTIRYRADINAFDTVIRWENQLFKIINTGHLSPQRRGQYLEIPAELYGDDSEKANE